MRSCILQKIPSPSPLFFRDKSSHRGEMHKNDDTLHKAAKPVEISCMSGDPVKKKPRRAETGGAELQMKGFSPGRPAPGRT